MDDWYSRPASHIIKELESSRDGLTEREARSRLERMGPNELAAPDKPGLFRRLLGQLKDPMILVLLAAAGLSLAASGGEDWLDGVIILGIVAGSLWSLSGLTMPLIMEKTVHNVAVLATPLGLMAMGASFDGKKAVASLKPALLASFNKLVLFSAIFLPLAVLLKFRGSELLSILVMLGSPTTISCYIMAKNMDHDGALTSNTVLITTLASAFTMTGWLYVLKVMGLI